jgi:hypothetical protein
LIPSPLVGYPPERPPGGLLAVIRVIVVAWKASTGWRTFGAKVVPVNGSMGLNEGTGF